MLHRGYEIAAFAVTAAYVPWFADAAGAPRWMLLSLIVPWTVRLKTITAAHYWGAGLLGLILLSMLWTPVPIEGVQTAWQFILLGALFCIGAELDDLEPIFVGAGWGMVASTWVAVVQMAANQEPTGLFLNKNFMAEAAVLILIGLAVYRQYLISILILPAIALPLARGAFTALAVVCCIAVWKRQRLVAAGLFLSFVAIGLLTQNSISFGLRAWIWRDTLAHLTLFGHGVGAFYIDFPAFADEGFSAMRFRFNHAHNDLLELVYDLGVGVIPMIVIMWMALRAKGNGVQYVLAGFAIESCVAFPLYLPVTGAVAALCAGHLCGVGHRLRQPVFVGERRVRAGARQFGLRLRSMALETGGRSLPA